MENLRISLAQINPTVGNLSGNREKIIEYINGARKEHSDIVIFPELALTGYPPEDLLLKKHFIKDNISELDRIVSHVKDALVILGYVDMDKKGNIYNAAAIIRNGKLKGVYQKRELPNYGVFDEKRYFTSSKKDILFSLGSIIFGVNICEDIWFENGITEAQAAKGAHIIINLSASPYYAGKIDVRKKMLQKHAIKTGCFVCYTNLVGGQDELVFDGGSMIIDMKGNEAARAEQFEENLVSCDLLIKNFKKCKSICKDIVPLGSLNKVKREPLAKYALEKIDELGEIYNALVLGTRDYTRKNGFQKVLIGLSGGIDSSLTAVIARDALGSENVIGVSMPSRYSSQDTQDDAKILAGNLGIKFLTIPIESIFNLYLLVLEKEFLEHARDVTEENLQARIRGNILMALSNKFKWLVLTTGNKSEVSCGYCTLYGDMAGGFSVLKDVPKTLVYKLAHFRNKKNGKKIIPDSVINREPTAELRHNQKDRDSLPPYEILDTILTEYVEKDKSLEDITADTGINAKIVKDIIRKIDINEYKRRQSPPGIKITPKAFGKDRRLPITNQYRQ